MRGHSCRHWPSWVKLTAMKLQRIRIEGYRSVRSVTLPVEPLNLLIGPNGVGKTNLYRGLSLLRAAATGAASREIVKEGGVGSVFWAGPRKRQERVRLKLEAMWEDIRYRIEIGLPAPAEAALAMEPLIKSEQIAVTSDGRPVIMLDRQGPAINLRNDDGQRETRDGQLLASQTALANLIDAERFPILGLVRQTLLDWRFYHGFRVDAGSPLRRPCPAVATTALASDGHDLAAVVETLTRIRGDRTELDHAIDQAFPGASLLSTTEAGRCSFALQLPDMQRPLEAHELSDGTLRYLALAGALAGYRLPAFIALNEPESSLHPDLMPALAGLIATAARRTTLWVVTHSAELARAIADETGVLVRQVIKSNGATSLAGLGIDGEFDD